VAIALSPVSVGDTTLSIRKFQNKRYNAQELVRIGMLSSDLLKELQEAILNRKNILISGGTGTGKTTLLNALTRFIPNEERLVVIEDTSEIQIDKPNVVRLEAREQQPGLPAITISKLLRDALRMRPDRIVLGEVRGAEGFDLLQAMNTGHQKYCRISNESLSGRGAVWLARLPWAQEVGGSNPLAPISLNKTHASRTAAAGGAKWELECRLRPP
jgi:Flp pilus assembly CpaF family ATPase